jgi:hemolysin III
MDINVQNNISLGVQGYSTQEERINALSHGFGLVLALIGLVYLVLKSESTIAIASSAIYGASLMLMFMASTIYHSVNNANIKRIFKLVDHSAIYVLIAGTYTPFLAVSLGGWIGWTALIVIWLIALFGVLFKIFAGTQFPKISVITYLVMGWLAVLLVYPLYQSVAGNGLLLLVAGGLCFSIGVIFYVKKHIKFTHAAWHFFVIAGCACHYFSIYYFVI